MSVLSIEFLKAVRERFSLQTFVETGCFKGDSVASALQAGYSIIRSCDISTDAVAECRARFESVKSVEILESDSVGALRKQLAHDLPPAFFWLDAHFPSFYGLPENNETKLPVFAEMAVIYKLRGGANPMSPSLTICGSSTRRTTRDGIRQRCWSAFASRASPFFL